MAGIFSILLPATLAVLLLFAAVGDWRTRRIPNWLNAAIALLAIPWWIVSGLDPMWGMAVQLGMGVAAFLFFAIFFYLRAMGGGDVKMIAALALWVPPQRFLDFLMIVAFAGGVLTLAMMIRAKIQKSEGKLKVPYGIAIVFGAFAVLAEPFLNQFG